ncbi:MAG: DUF2334 domain-containing protein [Nitrospinaceae bacterium]
MSELEWLHPIKQAIGGNSPASKIFFRDDDAGWCDEHLFQLLDIFSIHSIPLDIAVIPQALNEALASSLVRRWEKDPPRLGLHQHGFSHQNHEPEGRKCEFGPIRSPEEQLHDIHKGQQCLQKLLGGNVDPIFTPPWNRCSRVTADCLKNLNFKVLSRDVTADPLNVAGLVELPVNIDWFRRRKGVRISQFELGQAIANAIQSEPFLGIMLHHEPMEHEDFQALDQLLALFARHEGIHCCLMRNIVHNGSQN